MLQLRRCPCRAQPRHRVRPSVVVRASSATTLPTAEFLASTAPSYESLSSWEEVEYGPDNVLPWVPKAYPRVQAPSNANPIVILPGFGNCTLDYTEPFGVKEAAIKTALEARGFKVYVLPLERKDWFQVARAIFTRGFWSTSLTTHPGYTWYLKRVDATVQQALAETGAAQVDLIGHSAGGWLARAYLGDPAYFPVDASASELAAQQPAKPSAFARFTAALPSLPPLLLKLPDRSVTSPADGATTATTTATTTTTGTSASGVAGTSDNLDQTAEPLSTATLSEPVLRPNPRVRSVVTLGSPQRAVAPDKGRDVTGGALTWVHKTFPGAYFASAGVNYVSVGGRTVRGYRQAGEESKGPRTPPQYAFDSYQQVCGDGQGVEGDAVVPLDCAFLGGAKQVVLDGVFHSMSRIGTFDEDSGTVWYGSDRVVDAWLWALVDPAAVPSGLLSSGVYIG